MKRKALADLFRALEESSLTSALKPQKIYKIQVGQLDAKHRRYIYKSIEMQQMLQSMSQLHSDIQGVELSKMTTASANMLQSLIHLLKYQLDPLSQTQEALSSFKGIVEVDSLVRQTYAEAREEIMDLLSQLCALLKSSYGDFPSVSQILELVEKLEAPTILQFYDSESAQSLREMLETQISILNEIVGVYQSFSVPFFDAFILKSVLQFKQATQSVLTTLADSQQPNPLPTDLSKFEKILKYGAQLLYKFQHKETKSVTDLIETYKSVKALQMDQRKQQLLKSLCGIDLCETERMKLNQMLQASSMLSQMILDCQQKELESLSKLIYVVESVFVTLSFHGYCESKEDENQERQGEEEWKDGTGIGQGKGEQDVSKEIEHEQQVEGLRGDEEDDQQGEQGQKQDKEDQGFEMQQDFNPEEEKKDEKERDESQLDEEKGSVSELLDNQLWDENYSLGSGEEDEEERNEEPIDLQDRREADGPTEDKANQDEKKNNNSQREENQEEQVKDEQGEPLEEQKEQDNIPLDKDQHVSMGESEDDQTEEEDEFNQKVEGEEFGEQEQRKEEDADNDFDIEDLKEEEKLDQGSEKEFSFGNPEIGSEEDLEDNLEGEAPLEEQQEEEDKAQEEDIYGNAEEVQGQPQAGGGGGEQDQQDESMDVMEDIRAENEAKQGRAKGQNQEQNEKKDAKSDKNQGQLNKNEKAEEVNMGQREEDKYEQLGGEEYEAISQEEEATEDKAARGPTDKIEENPVEIQDAREDQEEEVGNQGILQGELTMEVEKQERNETSVDEKEGIQEEEKEQLNLEFKPYSISLTKLDLEQERSRLNEVYDNWLQSGDKVLESRDMLLHFKNTTGLLTGELCEKLRAVLEPTERSSFIGDFRSGKRLNMRKIIPFVASNFRNDKIWLRRSLPEKRDYRVLLAIDDSASMSEHGLGLFSLESLITLSTALVRLEVGRIAVAAIQDRLNLLHDFSDTLTQEKQSFLISQFSFAYHSATSSNTAMPNFLYDCNEFLLNQQRPSHFQIVIILSDGVLNKQNVRPLLRDASDKGLLYLFVILDSQPLTSSKSIFNKRSVRQENGKVSFSGFLEDFPFPHYCILTNIEHLPEKIAACMLQWIEETQQSS